ncbi:MAG: ligase-associated DNA damage response endonuclease PdeM [Methyloligellaceae bacterium]
MIRQLPLGLDDTQYGLTPSLTEIRLCGRSFVPDTTGALFWPEHATLIVSDLHLETGAAHAARGALLPPYDTNATLTALTSVVERFAPSRVISLGDNFHSVAAAERITSEVAERLRRLADGRDWYWVTGNHDPELPNDLAGRICPTVSLGGMRFRHEPVERLAANEIAGHLHPAARLTRRGSSVRRKCFISDGSRLVMPAFGAYTGGLNVLNTAFAPLFGGRDFFVWMLGRSDVYPVSRKQLLRD